MIKLFQNKRKLLITYIAFVLWFILALFLAKNVALAPWTLIIVFGAVTLVPGFALCRIFKINFENDTLGLFILYFTAGLIFSLIISFVAMMAGWNILILNDFYPWILASVFILAIAFDFLRPVKEIEEPAFKKSFQWRNVFQSENFLILFLILLSGVLLLVIGVQGSLFRGGDPSFHLSIIRKAFDGQSLGPRDLSFTKDEIVHIAYGFPILHIFWALLARFQNSDIFVLWKTISLPLAIMAILVWYWLFRQIFLNRFLALMSLLFFLIYINWWSNGWLFTCLPIPDTFNSTLVLPLTVGLSLKYIFNKSANYKVLLCLSILALLMAAIHLTQYIYFLFIVLFLLIMWLILRWRDSEYKPIAKKICWTLITGVLIILPFGILLEAKSHVISEVFRTYVGSNPVRKVKYDNFTKFNTWSKYGYLLLPLVFLFIRKNRPLIFVAALFLIVPIVYIRSVSYILMKVFGYIWVNRLFASVTWHFIALGFVSGLVFLLIGRGLRKISASIYWQVGVNILLTLMGGIFVYFQVKNQIALSIYDYIFGNNTNAWLGKNYILILAITIFVVLIFIVAGQYRPKILAWTDLAKLKGDWSAFVLTIVLALIFFSSSYRVLGDMVKVGLAQNYSFRSAGHIDLRTGNNNITAMANGVGGENMIAFVRENLPPKSVFLAPGTNNYIFPMFVDQYMATYNGTARQKRLAQVYQSGALMADKIKYRKSAQVEYILLNQPERQGEQIFDQNSANFKKIFADTHSVIYEVFY